RWLRAEDRSSPSGRMPPSISGERVLPPRIRISWVCLPRSLNARLSHFAPLILPLSSRALRFPREIWTSLRSERLDKQLRGLAPGEVLLAGDEVPVADGEAPPPPPLHVVRP